MTTIDRINGELARSVWETGLRVARRQLEHVRERSQRDACGEVFQVTPVSPLGELSARGWAALLSVEMGS